MTESLGAQPNGSGRDSSHILKDNLSRHVRAERLHTTVHVRKVEGERVLARGAAAAYIQMESYHLLWQPVFGNFGSWRGTKGKYGTAFYSCFLLPDLSPRRLSRRNRHAGCCARRLAKVRDVKSLNVRYHTIFKPPKVISSSSITKCGVPSILSSQGAYSPRGPNMLSKKALTSSSKAFRCS